MSVEIIGHRGARGMYPESSLAGFSAALELKVDRIELDIGITRDGVVVVHHDRCLNPDTTRDARGNWITDPCLRICDFTYAELSTFDVGRIRPGSEYAREFPHQLPCDGSSIPTLAKVVELLKKTNHPITLCIETKYSPQDPQATLQLDRFADIFAAELTRLGLSATAIVQSFDWQLMHAIQTRLPDVHVWHLTSLLPSFNTLDEALKGLWTDGLLVSDYAGSIPHMIVAAGGNTWSSDYQSLDRAAIASAHQLGLKTYAWTVNTAEDCQALCDAGVDGIITDYPQRLINCLQKLS